MRFKNLKEAIDNVGLMGCGNAADKVNDGVQAVADVTFVDAIKTDEKKREQVKDMCDELNDKAKGITPDNPGTGKKVKTPYTEKLTLDESLFTETL